MFFVRYNDLDANTTSICYLDKKQIGDVNFFNTKIRDIESETKCTINLHGIENQNGIVWIRIKNQLIDSRRFAILLINSYTNNSCKEVRSRELYENKILFFLLKIVLPKLSKPNKSTEIVSNKKKGLTRSSTEHSISSINSTSNTPFSSILSPFSEETLSVDKFNEPSLLSKTNDKKLQVKEEESVKKETRKRYNLDFLLARSTVDESKKLPKNWKELNLMYPNICFVGTVLSYFNASKYYDHWIRLQNENTELHNPIRTISNIQYLNLNQDKRNVDFMNREYLSLNNFNDNKTIKNNTNKSNSKNSLRFTTQHQQTKQDFKLNNKLASKNQTKQFCAT